MFNGSWSGRQGPAAFTYSTGTGALHAAGVHCYTFILMAKMCGVEVDEYMLQESSKQFYRFAGHGNTAYGDGFPEGGYTDNGKTSGLAIAMSAAALLTPEGESSLYAKARDHSAMKAFYATNWFHAAHTGGGMGEIWHHAAMNIVREKRPVPYRSYFDTRRWVMELSRRFDGSIGIAGMTDRYDVSVTDELRDVIDFGTYFAMSYTLHRKQLQLFGAPRSKFAKSHKLPERPWGNAADDIFLSNDPPENPFISIKDLLNEKVPTDSSFPIFQRTAKSEDELERHLYHPELGLRVDAIRVAVATGKHQHVLPLLKSEDARLRHLGILVIAGMFKGAPLPVEKVTPEMWDLIGKMIEDPNEAWWVVQDALSAMSRAEVATIAKHKTRIFELVETRNCSWTQTNGLMCLAKISTHPDHYKDSLARTLESSTKVWNNSASYRFNMVLRQHLKPAPPEVKDYAFPLLKKTYQSIPPKLIAKGGAVFGGGSESMQQRIAEVLRDLPGGGSFINEIPKHTLAYTRSGNLKDKFQFDTFKPDPRFVGEWLSLGKVYDGPPDAKNLAYRLRGLNEKTLNAKKKNSKKWMPGSMILSDGQKIKKGNRFWSGEFIIDNVRGEALRMHIMKIAGEEILFVENGSFGEPVNPDAKTSYEIFIRRGSPAVKF